MTDMQAQIDALEARLTAAEDALVAAGLAEYDDEESDDA